MAPRAPCAAAEPPTPLRRRVWKRLRICNTCLVGPPRRRSPCFCFLKGPPEREGVQRSVGPGEPLPGGGERCSGRLRLPGVQCPLGTRDPPLQTWVCHSLLPRASIRQVCRPERSPGSGSAANGFPSSADWETKGVDKPVLPLFLGDGTRRGKRWWGDFGAEGVRAQEKLVSHMGKTLPSFQPVFQETACLMHSLMCGSL